MFKRILFGIAWGCTFFTLVGIISVFVTGSATMDGGPEMYFRSAFGSMAVGMAFTVPTVVYEKERLAMAYKVLIHMGVGFAVFFPVAVYAQWIPVQLGVGAVLSFILAVTAGSFGIWVCFFLFFRREARRINKKLKEQNQP